MSPSSPDTFLYVPTFYNDDSPPVIGSFPDVSNWKATLAYVYSNGEFGLQHVNITVDGVTTTLGRDYLAAVKVPSLGDGSGHQYMTVAAFISPLKPGTHTISYTFSAAGQALASCCNGSFAGSASYTVIVH